MADPLLRLDATSVSVQPGGQVQVGVTVTSESDIVEGYRLTVLGANPSRWAEVVPPEVSVYPGAEAKAVVVLSPPSGTASPSGSFPFGVKATSTESAGASAVAEGVVEVGRVSGLQAKIVPVTSTGRWRGRHVVRLDNWGNAPARLRLVATDPDAALGFYLRPDVVDLPVGGSATVRLSARARRPFLRGTEVRRPFQVVGEPLDAAAGPTPATPYGDPSRPVVDAAVAQRPILTRGVVTLAGLVLVAAVAGGAWAWTRPQGGQGSLAGLGTPSTPEDFAVVSSDATSMRLRWKAVDQIESYGLQHVEVGDKETVFQEDPVNGSLNATVVRDLPPDTEQCFRLRAIRPGLPGPATAAVCARTAPAPPSPSPSAPASPTPTPSSSPSEGGGSSSPSPSDGGSGGDDGGSPTASPSSPTSPGTSPTALDDLGGGRWVLAADFALQSSPGGKERVEAVTAKLLDAGLDARTLDSTQFPDLRISSATEPLWVAAVGPYDSKDAADQDCGQVRTVRRTKCLAVQPDPS